MIGGSDMGFMDALRRGRDKAIAESKAATAAARRGRPASSAYGGCRVHGRRYDGCPLDMIEIARIEIEVSEVEVPPAPRPKDPKRR
jgi:hypothetical protein